MAELIRARSRSWPRWPGPGSTTSTCCSPTRATASPSRRTGCGSMPPPSASWPGTSAAASRNSRSQHRQVAVQLVFGDLAAVFLPFLALVAQEEVEDVLAEGFRDQLAVLHGPDGLVQVLRQRADAERAAFG